MEKGYYFMEIKDGSNLTYYFRSFLFSKGFRFRKKEKLWFNGSSDIKYILEMKEYCKKNGLVFISYTKNQKRSKDYRDVYFKNNKPIYKDYYICGYCLKPIHKKDVTVDHIIPVKKAKANQFYKWLLKKFRIDNINDERNLVASCQCCNAKKGKKAGLWSIRGFLGKYKVWILCYYLIIVTIIILLIFILVNARIL